MLGKFVSVREPNIKYLGLENMVRLAEVPAVTETVNRHVPFLPFPINLLAACGNVRIIRSSMVRVWKVLAQLEQSVVLLMY